MSAYTYTSTDEVQAFTFRHFPKSYIKYIHGHRLTRTQTHERTHASIHTHTQLDVYTNIFGGYCNLVVVVHLVAMPTPIGATTEKYEKVSHIQRA